MMKKLIKYQLIALLLTVLLFQNKAVADDNKSLTKQSLLSEKVVVVTDRELYLSGEKILFAATVFFEDGNIESDLSKIMYVELFKEDKPFVQAKFRINNGCVQGNIQLPTELLSGNYYLRAYTMFMRNGRPENFFNTLIRIVNPERKLIESSVEQQRPIVIEPEGGKFIDGIVANTAVLFNRGILSSIEKAIIINSKNDTLSEVFVYDNGLGIFSFTPILEQDYWMKLRLKDGDSVFIKLKETDGSGLVLQFDHQQTEVRVFSQGETRSLKIKLCSYSPEFEELSTEEIILNDSVELLNLSNVAFDKGVNYLVAKKENGEILSVKPIYIGAKDKMTFDVELDSTYAKREKIEIEISGLRENDLIFYSVAKKGLFTTKSNNLPMEFVFNPQMLNYNSEKVDYLQNDIIKQIELSFILNHNIFNSDEFKEKFSIIENGIEWLPEIRDLSISGLIRNRNTKEPLANRRIFASVLGLQPQIHSYLSDENGNFIFSLNQLEGIKDVGLTMDSINNIDAEIIVFSDFSNRFPLFRDYPLQIDSSSEKLLEEMYRNRQIGYKFTEVVLSHENYIDAIPFPFQDVQSSILLEDFIDLPTMQEVFNEIITYVNARKRGGKFILNVLNDATETLYDKPLVLVDNMPVFDIDKIMRIKPSKVEKIEVITRPYSFGEMSFNGIVMITTKTDDFGGVSLPNETVFLKYSTSSLSSKQVFPEFKNDNSISSNQPYFSNTIYWNTDINSQNSGVKQYFYSSDESGMFEVLVKVLSISGELQQEVKSIKIN